MPRARYVELPDGVIMPASPISPGHAAQVARLGELLRSQLGGRGLVREEKAITLEPVTQPEPDLAIVPARSDFYARAQRAAISSRTAARMVSAPVKARPAW